MDYGRPDIAEPLAAEYVLGSLRGGARRRFEALLPAHPALRAAAGRWQDRLAPLSVSVAPAQPRAAVWQAVQRRVFGEPPPAPPLRWWQRVGLWRGVSGVATAAAVALFVATSQAPVPQPPLVVVLAADPQAPPAAATSFVASISADGRALVLRPLGEFALTPDRALELWAVPAQGAPRSLGLVQPRTTTTLIGAQLLRDTAALAVSVEPPGGSPTGAPTGPIVSVGRLRT